MTNHQVPEELLSKINEASKDDILELQGKIAAFRGLQMDEDKFRAFRLARGVYGQRQQGVQMIRIKLPYGKVTPDQLIRIADVSDRYASSNLHLTTRQDIQIHYVQLENSPKVWAELEEVDVTLREACGNTVRNVTASATAGIDPLEPFDVTPYAHAFFEYFLRNPICQEMGRKFKVAFSNTEEDTAFGFMHDLGFIPRVRTVNGKEERGFKILIGGGLGAQPFLALTVHEFLSVDEYIPFSEAVIRVFDRYGERAKRHKARMKYLVHGLGLDEFMKLVEEEKVAVKNQTYKVDTSFNTDGGPSNHYNFKEEAPANVAQFEAWVKSNVFEQKQKGWYGVYLRQHLGDLHSDKARVFANIVKKYASDDIRITVNQGWLLKYVKKEALAGLFNELNTIGLALAGFDSTADITACPGTDTCNLGISSSTGISVELERMFAEEFPDLVFNRNIKIKISGCMNACGQHTIANIGFHGMSMKSGERVLPAMQVLLGGGLEPDGTGSIADKVIKLPSKRCPEAVRILLNDYEDNGQEGEYFNAYYRRQVAADKMYFYKMLKPLGELSTLVDRDFIDWGHEDQYVTEVGVGECAGVMLDLVGILIQETEDKLKWANKFAAKGAWTDAIYAGYAVFVSGAKALLTAEGVNCNTQINIIRDFDKHVVAKAGFDFGGQSFEDYILRMNKQAANAEFGAKYLQEAAAFIEGLKAFRQKQVVPAQ